MNNFKDNVKEILSHASQSQSAGTANSATPIHMGAYLNGKFSFNVGTIASGRTLTLTLQHSSTADFSSDVVDEVGTTGNSTVVEAVAGVNALYINAVENPEKPYYRVKAVTAGGAIVYGGVFHGLVKVTPANT